MRLIIGGAHSGKTAYLETLFPDAPISDGASCPLILPQTVYAVNHLHLLVRRWLDAGCDPLEEALAVAARCPAVCFVCDEVGCGIVPAERADRDWRDAVGKLCCALAERATRVERVFCGIVQTILESDGGEIV